MPFNLWGLTGESTQASEVIYQGKIEGSNKPFTQRLELRSKSGLLAQFVGSYPVKRTVPLNWYCLNTIGIDRVSAALTQ
jgi:hypothetical protein